MSESVCLNAGESVGKVCLHVYGVGLDRIRHGGFR